MEFLAIDQYVGELAALSAAFLWAASSAVYGLLGQRIGPLQLNLYKGLVALVLIAITLALRAELPQLEAVPAGILLLSGAAGIGFGDTAYFAALNRLGPRKTLLMETLAPPFTAVLALVFLGEQLSAIAWCGILVTVLGVAWVIAERTPSTTADSNVRGIIWGVFSEIAQAVGAVLSRFALVESAITPLGSTLLRLTAGTVVVLLLLWVRPRRDRPTAVAWSVRLVSIIAIASFGSTYLGIWLQQASLKFAPAGIAQTLLATSPLFVLPIAAAMGDKISPRALLGVIVAIAGIALLFNSSQ